MTKDCLGEYVCRTSDGVMRCKCETNVGAAITILILIVVVVSVYAIYDKWFN